MSHPPFKGGQGRDVDSLRAAADACSTVVAIAIVAAVVASLIWLAQGGGL